MHGLCQVAGHLRAGQAASEQQAADERTEGVAGRAIRADAEDDGSLTTAGRQVLDLGAKEAAQAQRPIPFVDMGACLPLGDARTIRDPALHPHPPSVRGRRSILARAGAYAMAARVDRIGLDRGGRMRRLVGILSLAAVEVGALVGGGFASGREVHEFFARHGAAGHGGIVLFALLLAVLGGICLEAARRGSTRSYRELTRWAAGPWVAGVADPLVALALFLGLAVSIAGCGALVASLGLGARLGGIVAACLMTGAIARRGGAGVVVANAVIVPLLVLVLVRLTGLPPADMLTRVGALDDAAARAAVLYFLYNGLLAVVLLASLGGQARRPIDGWVAAVLAALVLGGLAAAVDHALGQHPASVRDEIPLLTMAVAAGPTLARLYAAALAAALLTTAVGNAFGLCVRLSAASVDGKVPTRLVLLAVAAAGALALTGFAPLVRYGYRLVAVAGAAYLGAVGIAVLARLGRGCRARW